MVSSVVDTVINNLGSRRHITTMNTFRQLFSVRTLAALKQTVLVNTPLDLDIAFTNRFKTTSTSKNTLLSKDASQSTVNIQLGLVNKSVAGQYKNLYRKLEIVYRCKVCNTRNNKTVSEAAYINGVVILQCDGCSTTHLIVDNLGWFSNSKGKSVDQVIAENSELVRKVVVNEKGEMCA